MKNKPEVWPLPAEIETDDYRCVVLRIPNRPEYISAFYDSYDALCRWLSWERRGDNTAVRAAQLFRKFDPLWIDCEIGDSIDEEGNMAITVNLTTNCNCSCGDTTINIPPPVYPDGTPITTVCLPVNPSDPFGDNPPPSQLDPTEEIPPTGWPDWQTFIDDKCLMANYAFDFTIGLIAKLDDAINQLDEGKSVMDSATTLMLLLRIPVVKQLGFVTIAQYVSRLAAGIALASGQAEDFKSWLHGARSLLENLRDEYVCIVYNWYTLPETMTQKLLELIDGVVGEVDDFGLTDAVLSILRDLVKKVLTDVIPTYISWLTREGVPDGYIATYDCNSCLPSLDGGFFLIPVNFTYQEPSLSGGIVLTEFTSVGNELRMRGAGGAGDMGAYLKFDVDIELGAIELVGWELHRETDADLFRFTGYTSASQSIWGGGTITEDKAITIVRYVRGTQGNEYNASNPDYLATITNDSFLPFVYEGYPLSVRLIFRHSLATPEWGGWQKLYMIARPIA